MTADDLYAKLERALELAEKHAGKELGDAALQSLVQPLALACIAYELRELARSTAT